MGTLGTYKKLNEDQMVIMDDKSLMSIREYHTPVREYIKLYYQNVLDSVIGFRKTQIITECRIWDTAARQEVEDCLWLCPEGSTI